MHSGAFVFTRLICRRVNSKWQWACRCIGLPRFDGFMAKIRMPQKQSIFTRATRSHLMGMSLPAALLPKTRIKYVYRRPMLWGFPRLCSWSQMSMAIGDVGIQTNVRRNPRSQLLLSTACLGILLGRWRGSSSRGMHELYNRSTLAARLILPRARAFSVCRFAVRSLICVGSHARRVEGKHDTCPQGAFGARRCTDAR